MSTREYNDHCPRCGHAEEHSEAECSENMLMEAETADLPVPEQEEAA